MTSSSKCAEAFDPAPAVFGNHFSIADESGESRYFMRVLERLALTLGVPVEAFFSEHGGSTTSDAATASEIDDLTQAFLAITDPIMRRYCLDVVRAAGIEERTDAPA